MKLLFDFFPVIVFYVFYKIFNIYVATGALIIASLIQITYLWLRYKKVDTMLIVAFVLVLIFGGLTIFLHDVMFLKWKVSIINWLFGAAFILVQLFAKKPLIQYLMEKNLQLPTKAWSTLNLMWGGFFILMGIINIIIVYSFSTATWVDFKVFGMLGLTLAFVILQTIYLMKYLKKS